MALDKEQQARLTFLTEAETYFSEIESVLLTLKNTTEQAAKIDVAMRAAHSVKGTAGMMGFVELSQAAHSLESSFKILRARQLSVDTHLETLLLQGVDSLRIIRHHYHRQQPINDHWLTTEVEPIFAELNQRLGDLTPEDEARLLSEDNNENLDFVIFTTSVEDGLTEFEQTLPQVEGDALRPALMNMARQMSEFGRMAQLEPFVSLCQTVEEQCLFTPSESLGTLAQQAIQAWRRSHALVVLGRTERLPTQLKSLNEDKSNDLDELPIQSADLAIPDISEAEINQLQDQLAELDALSDISEDASAVSFAQGDIFEPIASTMLIGDELGDDLMVEETRFDESVDLEALQQQFAALQSETVSPLTTASAPVPIPLVPLTVPPRLDVGDETPQSATVRVSVDQLRQINRTFEALVLDRNSINLKFEQLQAFSLLMQQRMTALTSFNKGLRQWYDQASIEAVGEVAFSSELGPARLSIATNGGAPNGARTALTATAPNELDVLEFDQYSQLHLLAQDHMETIVKLEEVSRDLELGLNDLGQSVNSLNYTSQTLKNHITQTQMRPFEEIVSRFPRVVRDWSVQYGKSVQLELDGVATLIEQVALDQLSDPLMHLLRNAFDHGIEPPEVRQAQQKAAMGTITLRAMNRSNRVVITLSDDGNGIDLDRVRERVRQYNLPDAQVNRMTRQELLSFIFEPGFSTSNDVTELSGRGVGMDVVRTNLKALQGDIQIATEPGKGTTFTISIPLSLSILRVMLLEHQGFVFAVPVDQVQEVIRAAESETSESSLQWKDNAIPLIQLDQYWGDQRRTSPFEMEGQPLINCPVRIVVGEGDRAYGVTVDRFWQEQDVAIRSVASPKPLTPGFGGVTVLGDGRVIPLMDPIRFLEWVETEPDSSTPQMVAPPPAETVSTPRILIVDDSIHARQYLATTLERSGYLIEQAKDGREAVDKLFRGLPVEAVICDIEMPRLDGYGVLEELREAPEWSELPILMLTSRSSEKHRKLAMNLGATAYFVKPYNEQELLLSLRELTVEVS